MDQSVDAKNYVNAIEHKLWAAYAFEYPRFGHDTNNITESVNAQWVDIRKLPPLQMMDAIYTLLMKTVYERHHRNQRSTELVDVLLLKFNERLINSRRYQVFASGNGIYQVQIPDSRKKHIVNLKEHTCNCMLFEEYQSLCTHAIIACQYESEDPYKLFAEEYTLLVYRKTYSHFLWPLSIENLESASGVLPPVFKKQRGRPTTKRIRKGARKRKEKKCSKCHGTGHNIRKCRFAPAINGRQQRTQERELSIASSSSSSASSASSASSRFGSDADEEVFYNALDEVDQAESDLYYKQVARAWEIVNHQQDLESDSELSVQASSLFASIEVGGISQGDSMGSTSQGDSMDISKANNVQEVVTSPRRTRSGKVVRYKDE